METIICIEDEPLVRKNIVEELEDLGLKVFEAADGFEGLQLIFKHQPDLVICDITMPRMSGLELLRHLRDNHKYFDEMPFLFLSAIADDASIISGLKKGAYNYLTKPVDFDLLGATVLASLDHVRTIKEKSFGT